MLSKKTNISKSVRAIVAIGLLGAAATASASCRTSALECAAATGGMLGACGAAAAQIGLDPAFDYACPVAAMAFGGACAAMAEECGDDTTTNNPSTSSGGSKGTVSGTKQTLTCGTISSADPYLNRVTGFYFKQDTVNSKASISAIRMHCSSGATGTFIGNSGTSGTTWTGGICSNGRLAAGLQVRSDSTVNALARICDPVSYSSTDSDNITATPIFGGSAGTLGNLKCAENKYIWGLNVWYDGTLPLDRRVVKGVELLCRGY